MNHDCCMYSIEHALYRRHYLHRIYDYVISIAQIRIQETCPGYGFLPYFGRVFIRAFLKSKVLLISIAYPPTPFPAGRGKTVKLGSAGAERLQNPFSPTTPRPGPGAGLGVGSSRSNFKKSLGYSSKPIDSTKYFQYNKNAGMNCINYSKQAGSSWKIKLDAK